MHFTLIIQYYSSYHTNLKLLGAHDIIPIVLILIIDVLTWFTLQAGCKVPLLMDLSRPAAACGLHWMRWLMALSKAAVPCTYAASMALLSMLYYNNNIIIIAYRCEQVLMNGEEGMQCTTRTRYDTKILTVWQDMLNLNPTYCTLDENYAMTYKIM